MEPVKKQKIDMMERLLKEDLEKIARIENISTEGSKEDLLNRLANNLTLQSVDNYLKKLSLRQIFDISDHALVPKHRVLPESEKEKLLQQYKITIRHLPRISIRDPAVLVLDAKPGDVIEITRKSPIAGEIKYYRAVSKPKK